MKPSFRQKFRFWFDNLMSRGTPAMIGMLFALSLAIVFIAGALLALTGFAPEDGDGHLSFFEAAWLSLMRTLDPGTMGGDVGWGFRVVMLGVTFGGIFVISTFIGVITSGIETRLADLPDPRCWRDGFVLGRAGGAPLGGDPLHPAPLLPWVWSFLGSFQASFARTPVVAIPRWKFCATLDRTENGLGYLSSANTHQTVFAFQT